MRYGILGPVEVWDSERRLPVGGPQPRALLAALLLHANLVVPVDRLVEVLWRDHPPVKARSLVQGCVAGLRRVLPGDPLVTHPPGYLLQVAPGEWDLGRFEQLVGEAGSPDADPARSARLLREALALWRGPALGGVPVDSLRLEAVALEERRLAALEDRIEVDLRLDRHASLVGELRQLVQDQPLRERLWAQLMRALAGAGRPAEALAAYQRLRDSLVEQLGLEPGATVQRLYHALRTGAEPASRPIPAQLPATPGAFTGRAAALEWLDGLLAQDRPATPIGAISGTAGVGKTALAVHWAHRARGGFPDGQLYLDLRGYAATPPVRPAEALAGFLAALGVPADEIPVEPEPAAALFRTQLAGRRVLVLLDNAASAEQIRPLLPGSGGSLVLVTSRDRLGGLIARDGAVHFGLELLDLAEAQELLARVLGPERVRSEPAAAPELARLCGYLPLALRIAAANLTLHPRRLIADQVAELADDRLAALRADDDPATAVRVAFDHSYSVLAPAERRMFRLLGLVPGPDITAEGAAALAGQPVAAATRQLQRLAAAHLLGQPAPVRYALHDLLRQYAAERAHEEPEPAATERLFDWYLSVVDAAARVLSPEKLRLPLPVPPGRSFEGHPQALAWLDAERPNLLAAIRHAAEQGPRPVAWQLADALRGYFGRRMTTADWLAAAGHGLAAAEAAGDAPGQAMARLSLADAYNRRSDYQQAIAHYDRARELFQRAEWAAGEASVLCNSGGVYLELGQLERAAEQTKQALVLFRQTGMAAAQAVCLGNLSGVYGSLGRLAEAAEHATEALAVYRGLGSVWGEATSLGYLGDIRRNQGRLDEALTLLGQALALHRDAGNRGGESDVLRALAAVHAAAGRAEQAMDAAQAALALARETADPRIEADVLTVLGTIHILRSDYQAAVDHCEHALALARSGRMPPEEAAALVGLAVAGRHLGQTATARSYAGEALEIARAGGFGVIEAMARDALATIEADR